MSLVSPGAEASSPRSATVPINDDTLFAVRCLADSRVSCCHDALRTPRHEAIAGINPYSLSRSASSGFIALLSSRVVNGMLRFYHIVGHGVSPHCHDPVEDVHRNGAVMPTISVLSFVVFFGKWNHVAFCEYHTRRTTTEQGWVSARAGWLRVSPALHPGGTGPAHPWRGLMRERRYLCGDVFWGGVCRRVQHRQTRKKREPRRIPGQAHASGDTSDQSLLSKRAVARG